MRAIRRPADPLFGRYQPIALLGDGSVARVYLALDRGPLNWGDPLVIKEIRPELACQPQFRDMFLHEARMALRLHHPNIVRTFEIFEERAPYVVAMEFLDGQSLADVLRRLGRSEVSLALHLWILTQVLAGLHHAYEVRDAEGKPLRIVHRDVSPGNVFVTYDGQIKLVDFGIAKFTGMIARNDGQAASGKLGYGAPEQFVSQPIDPRSDVYSVGVMLWEALAGKRRRVSEDPRAVVDARIAGREPKIGDVAPRVSPALAEICDRATALDRRARYRSALEMRQALESYLDGCGQPVDRWELGELMGRTFSAERASTRRCIERHLNVPRPGRERQRRGPLAGLLPVLARGWGRFCSVASPAVPILRSHGPPALAVVATAALVTVLWSTGSRSPAPRVPAPAPSPAPAVVVHPPAPAPLRPPPAPVVTPAPITLTAGADPRPVPPQVRPIVRARKDPPSGRQAPPRRRLLDVPADEDLRRRGRLSRRPALDEEDPYAP
jgi:hypothetical protein